MPIAFVQASANNGSASPLSLTLPVPSTPGDAVVAGLMWDPESAGTPTLSDDHGNTYALAGAPQSGVGILSTRAGALAYAVPIAANASPLSFTLAGGAYTSLELAVAEFQGVDPVAPLDGFGSNASDTAPMLSAQLTASTTGDLLVGWGICNRAVQDAGAGLSENAWINGDMLESGVSPFSGPLTGTAYANDPNWIFLFAAFHAVATGG